MSDGEQSAPVPATINATIEWHVPFEIQSRYATILVSQPLKNEFVLSFFEPQLPILVGAPQEVAVQAQQIKSIRAECVARIIVAANQMPEIMQVLKDGWDKFQQTYASAQTSNAAQ